jgi:hypothetical protein
MAAVENAKRIRVPSRHPFDRAAFSVRWRSDTLGLLQRQDAGTRFIRYRDLNATSREIVFRKPISASVPQCMDCSRLSALCSSKALALRAKLHYVWINIHT